MIKAMAVDGDFLHAQVFRSYLTKRETVIANITKTNSSVKMIIYHSQGMVITSIGISMTLAGESNYCWCQKGLMTPDSGSQEDSKTSH